MDIYNKITNLTSVPSLEEFSILESSALSYLLDTQLANLVRKTHPKDKLDFDANQELLLLKAKDSINTYINISQKWKGKFPFDKYLYRSLHNLIFNINSNNKNINFKNKYICPGCNLLNIKTFLEVKNNYFNCHICYEKINNKDCSQNVKIICNIFANHSKEGGKCPSCLGWLPSSLFKDDLGFCPYCDFSGSAQELIPATHPQSMFMIKMFDQENLDTTSLSANNSWLPTAHYNFNKTNDVEQNLSLKEDFIKHFNVLSKVLKDQNNSLSNKSTDRTLIQKHLMYQAFYNMLHKIPLQMVNYLVHQQVPNGFGIQSKIFQEYCSLIEDYLPIKNKDVIITDYCDPNLNLYLGISTFSSVLEKDFSIKNKTNEVYIGGKKLINYGPCFLGRLVSIADSSGKDVTSYVKEYSFSNIKLFNNNQVLPGEVMTVKHFRIASHYEMGPLVFLQKIRKDITTKTKRLIHGK